MCRSTKSTFLRVNLATAHGTFLHYLPGTLWFPGLFLNFPFGSETWDQKARGLFISLYHALLCLCPCLRSSSRRRERERETERETDQERKECVFPTLFCDPNYSERKWRVPCYLHSFRCLWVSAAPTVAWRKPISHSMSLTRLLFWGSLCSLPCSLLSFRQPWDQTEGYKRRKKWLTHYPWFSDTSNSSILLQYACFSCLFWVLKEILHVPVQVFSVHSLKEAGWSILILFYL